MVLLFIIPTLVLALQVKMGPNLHISKMAAIHTAKMLIAITQ